MNLTNEHETVKWPRQVIVWCHQHIKLNINIFKLNTPI